MPPPRRKKTGAPMKAMMAMRIVETSGAQGRSLRRT